jgi:hypothetical protein
MMRYKMFLSQLVVMAALCACKKEGDFSAGHFNEIQKDCSESLICMSPGMIAANQALQDCIEDGGDMLDSASERGQTVFIETVNRCATLQQCDYLSCTKSNPNSGYAALHQAQISADCMQQVACQIAQGRIQTQAAVENCIMQQSNVLNFAPAQQQVAFEARFTKCSGQVACAWVNCQ